MYRTFVRDIGPFCDFVCLVHAVPNSMHHLVDIAPCIHRGALLVESGLSWILGHWPEADAAPAATENGV